MRNNQEIMAYLKQLKDEQNLSISEIARRVGMAKSAVSRYFNGSREFPLNHVSDFAKALHTTPEDVLGIESKTSASLPTASNIIYPQGLERVQIPLIGEIACGDPITAEENIEGYVEEIFEKPVPSGNLFALRCKGNSMEPTIPNGALAIIREQPTVEDGEIAAVLVDDDNEATLKRVKHQGNLVMLMPDNKTYDPIILDEDHPGRIVGKLVKYSVTME